MNQKLTQLAEQLLRSGVDDLSADERSVLTRIATRVQVSRNLNAVFDDRLSLGERVADRVAAFGGSWPFIIVFAAVLAAWIVTNSFLLQRRAFDPYPYILLNLFLSMLAAIQAPVIMMSQNRQSAKDRLAAAHDYEVNLKAELEIMRLHDKLDEVRQQHLAQLLEKQERQLLLIQQLVDRRIAASVNPHVTD
ncbi:MAG TPA: DUF1003 domain-containing protein [Steroidobacteraceae bacterium]|jgi:uncharacterized membrane protein